MTVFSQTWNASFEAIPANGDDASEGALRIRNLKREIQERGEVDHSWAGNGEDGTHKKITFTDPLASKPVQELDNTYLYTKDVAGTSELFFEDEAGNEIQLTSAGAAQAFPAGTKMIFFNNAAPAGWTIDATWDNHIIFVEGTEAQGGDAAGTIDATTLFAAGKATSSEGAHSHTNPNTGQANAHSTTAQGGVTNSYTLLSHTHTQGDTGTEPAHSHTISLAVKYVKGIICTKD